MRRRNRCLDPAARNSTLVEVEDKLRKFIVGQDEGVSAVMRVLTTHAAGCSQSGRPIAVVLLLGPTGVGKTRLCEALAEALYGQRKALLRVDCGEMQNSHEVAKLIGSPPGYLGHRETTPVLTQHALNACHTEQVKISLLLFDEVEKAHENVRNTLLGVFDKAELRLGDNSLVNFEKTIIFMTSNLGAREMNHELGDSPKEPCRSKSACGRSPWRLPGGSSRRSSSTVSTRPWFSNPSRMPKSGRFSSWSWGCCVLSSWSPPGRSVSCCWSRNLPRSISWPARTRGSSAHVS